MLNERINEKSKNVTIKPIPFLYEMDVFNECEQNGYVLISLDSWKNVHPSLVTIPLEEKITCPYGIIYSKTPSKQVEKFVNIIKNALSK